MTCSKGVRVRFQTAACDVKSLSSLFDMERAQTCKTVVTDMDDTIMENTSVIVDHWKN